MPNHKSEDYKTTAVKYYLKNNIGMIEVCEIFNCSKPSLSRWIEKYKETGQIKRNNRKSVSYKITKKQVEYAIQKLKDNEQITMKELAKIIKKKHKTFDVTPQHLGKVIRDNNKTRKRTRHEHFPSKRYGKDIDKKKELNKFYKEIKKYNLNKIISIDETSYGTEMKIHQETSTKLHIMRYTKKNDQNIYVVRKLSVTLLRWANYNVIYLWIKSHNQNLHNE